MLVACIQSIGLNSASLQLRLKRSNLGGRMQRLFSGTEQCAERFLLHEFETAGGI